MTTQAPSLETIRARKQELLSSAAHYDTLAAKARAEAAECEAAERVWLHLFGESAPVLARRALGHNGAEAAPSPRLPNSTEVAKFVDNMMIESRKQLSRPPMTEIIVEALKSARDSGKGGMTPIEILAYVREKWWPEAKSTDVGSTAWRMWREGRLVKPDEAQPIYAWQPPTEAPATKENAA